MLTDTRIYVGQKSSTEHRWWET